jgi:hypothetical protein
MITLALSKGRIFDDTLPLLRAAGIEVTEDPERSRKLILATTRPDARVVLVRASDVPTYVRRGGADIGVAGLDVLLEDEAEKAEQSKTAEEFKPLVERVKAALGERAKDVRVTLRLTDSPACLVVEEGDMGMNLERLLKAAGQSMGPGSTPILEINPHHALVERLGAETDEARFADWANLLFEQAMLAEGGQLDDPGSFVRRLNGLMLALAGAVKEPSRIVTP